MPRECVQVNTRVFSLDAFLEVAGLVPMWPDRMW